MAGKGTRAVWLALAAFGCCLAIAGGASAGAGPTERIVGGDVADPADWPFIAAIASRSGDQFCGGSVVAEEAVVTAAHCVVGSRPKNVRVITGRPDLDEESDGKEIKVEEISVHREYLRRGHHDIAVLSLKEPAEAPPFCCRRWPRTSPRPSRATSCGSPGGAGPRRPAAIPRTSFSMSRSSPSRMRSAAPTSASSGPPRRSARSAKRSAPTDYNDSCFGDSGGPLVADAPRGALLVGIVSYGGSKCGVKKPGVYSQVADNLGFIERKAGL